MRTYNRWKDMPPTQREVLRKLRFAGCYLAVRDDVVRLTGPEGGHAHRIHKSSFTGLRVRKFIAPLRIPSSAYEAQLWAITNDGRKALEQGDSV